MLLRTTRPRRPGSRTAPGSRRRRIDSGIGNNDELARSSRWTSTATARRTSSRSIRQRRSMDRAHLDLERHADSPRATAASKSTGGYSANSQFFAMDINGDGKMRHLELYPNCVTSCKPRDLDLERHRRSPRASSRPGLATRPARSSIAMDINGDGKTDIVELYDYFGAVPPRSGCRPARASSPVATRLRRCIERHAEPLSSRWTSTATARRTCSSCTRSSGRYQRKTWLSNGNGFALVSDGQRMPFDTTPRSSSPRTSTATAETTSSRSYPFGLDVHAARSGMSPRQRLRRRARRQRDRQRHRHQVPGDGRQRRRTDGDGRARTSGAVGK